MNPMFMCPECESHHFGANETKGRCHGCGHEWDRTQDYVYFVKMERFKSPREYERFTNGSERRMRMITTAAIALSFFATLGSLVGLLLERVP